MKRRRNEDFEFHSFAVADGGAAMKVGTDAMVLSAIASATLSATGSLVDVGCGTGVLGLNVGQAVRRAPHPKTVTAVDIVSAAAVLAQLNLKRWRRRTGSFDAQVRCGVGDASQMDSTSTTVLCNPPFYSEAEDRCVRGKARASSALPPHVLAHVLSRATLEVAVVYPLQGTPLLLHHCEGCGLHCFAKWEIADNSDVAPSRAVLLMRRAIVEPVVRRLDLYCGVQDRTYSPEYKALLTRLTPLP